MKSLLFKVDTVDKVFLLLDFFARQGETWIFRGQANSKWPLETSLERAFKKFKLTDKNARYAAERHIIEMGDRVLCQYRDISSLIKDKLDLLAFIQHFGGVTRLLDFTDSFPVALFFASESASDSDFDVSVWCLRRDELRRDNINLRNRDKRREFASQILECGLEMDSVIAFAPSVLNARLYAQQGLFVMPCSFEKSLADLLACVLQTDLPANENSESDLGDLNVDSKNAVLLKFDVDKNILRDVLVALRKLNVSADHLFPDITGICRSLSLLASGYRLNKDKFDIRGEL